jgi:hypothetical protein
MLTDTQVQKAKPPEKGRVRKVADYDGLYLYVYADHAKEWWFRYRKPRAKTDQALKIADYPATSLRNARKKVVEMRGLLDDGIDPAAHRKELRRRELADLERGKGGSFTEIAERWWLTQINAAAAMTPGTLARNRAILDHAISHLGALQFDEVASKNVRVMADIIRNQFSIDYAKRVVSFTSQIFQYGIEDDLCPFDVAHPVLAYLKKKASEGTGISRLIETAEQSRSPQSGRCRRTGSTFLMAIKRQLDEDCSEIPKVIYVTCITSGALMKSHIAR